MKIPFNKLAIYANHVVFSLTPDAGVGMLSRDTGYKIVSINIQDVARHVQLDGQDYLGAAHAILAYMKRTDAENADIRLMQLIAKHFVIHEDSDQMACLMRDLSYTQASLGDLLDRARTLHAKFIGVEQEGI